MQAQFHANPSPVVKYIETKQYGTLFINTPWHYGVTAIGCIILLIALSLFLFFGCFTEKYTVTGFLDSNTGLVQIFPKQPGIISKRYVHIGMEVERGQPLFAVDTAFDETLLHTPTQIFLQLKQKRALLLSSLKSKQNFLMKLKPLLNKKYISEASYHSKSEEIMTLKNQLHQLNIELIKYKQSRSYVVHAPIAGFISSIMSEPGQFIKPSHVIANILPKGSHFLAQLYVPVNKAGFLHGNETVSLRFDAYPYQHFGVAQGKITEISRNIFTDQDEIKPIKIGKPYYKVKADLAKQTINLYGQEQHLHHGITFTAIINGPRKKVWQWVFEPLLSASHPNQVA